MTIGTQADNIIPFPGKFRGKQNLIDPPQTLEEVEETIDNVKEAHIQQTLEYVMPAFFDNLANAGFQPADENELLKDGALIVESVRSFMNKLYDMYHPMQVIADGLFEPINNNGQLQVVNNIKITLSTTPPPEK